MSRKDQQRQDTLRLLDARAPEGATIELLSRGLRTVTTPEAEYELLDVAERIRGVAAEAVADAGRWVEATRDTDPFLGWSLPYLLDACDLYESDEAIELFGAEAAREFGGEGRGCGSFVDLQELVAVQAGEALAHLAVHGGERAAAALVGVLGRPETSRAVRLAAGRVAVSSGDDRLAEAVTLAVEELAEALRWPVLASDDLVATHEPIGRPGRKAPPPPSLTRLPRGRQLPATGAPHNHRIRKG